VGGRNQADLRVLVDCAELAIYGKRRQGFKLPYVGPHKISHYLEKAHPDTLEPDGKGPYRGAVSHRPFSLSQNGVKEGDILHFGDQVSILFEDRGRKGLLDPDDLMLYTYNHPPKISSLRDSEFRNRPLKVYRWKF
jgi:hypothetical protein